MTVLQRLQKSKNNNNFIKDGYQPVFLLRIHMGIMLELMNEIADLKLDPRKFDEELRMLAYFTYDLSVYFHNKEINIARKFTTKKEYILFETEKRNGKQVKIFFTTDVVYFHKMKSGKKIYISNEIETDENTKISNILIEHLDWYLE